MLNVVMVLFEQNILEEKEIHDAREKVRAQMLEAFLPEDETRKPGGSQYNGGSGVGTDAPLRELNEGDIDEFGRVVPKKRQATSSTKPALKPTLPTEDEDNPFGLLEGPLR